MRDEGCKRGQEIKGQEMRNQQNPIACSCCFVRGGGLARFRAGGPSRILAHILPPSSFILHPSSLICLVTLLFCVSPVLAQFKEGDPGGAKTGAAQTHKWKAGVVITAVGGPCKSIVGYVPVPIEWPEQTVKVVRAGHFAGSQGQLPDP